MNKREGKRDRVGARETRLKTAPMQEPKRDTPEWVKWKVKQMRAAFFATDNTEVYAQAWSEFKVLLGDLITDGNFWHISNAVRLLPHLLVIRQELELMDRHEKRVRAGMKAAETRKVRSAAS
jgi:hypothetical protein